MGCLQKSSRDETCTLFDVFLHGDSESVVIDMSQFTIVGILLTLVTLLILILEHQPGEEPI